MAVRRRASVGVDGSNAQDTGLDEEVPYAARLVDIDLDELTRFAPTQLSASPRVLAHQGLFDDEVGLG